MGKSVRKIKELELLSCTGVLAGDSSLCSFPA